MQPCWCAARSIRLACQGSAALPCHARAVQPAAASAPSSVSPLQEVFTQHNTTPSTALPFARRAVHPPRRPSPAPRLKPMRAMSLLAMPLPLSSQAAKVTLSDCTPASAAALHTYARVWGRRGDGSVRQQHHFAAQHYSFHCPALDALAAQRSKPGIWSADWCCPCRSHPPAHQSCHTLPG